MWLGENSGGGRVVRLIAILAVMTAGILLPSAAPAQNYDEATVKAHLVALYQHNGPRLFKWKRPIRYIVTGLESETTKQLVEGQFAYIRDLTGLDIQKADPAKKNGNFLLLFASPLASIAHLENVRAVFGRGGQSDTDYFTMLKELDRDGLSRSVTKKTSDAIVFHAALINPTSWDEKLIVKRVLKYVVGGLTEAGSSDVIRPSIFNADVGADPISRLPTIDEFFLRNFYRQSITSGQPLERGLDRLAAAISFDLLD